MLQLKKKYIEVLSKIGWEIVEYREDDTIEIAYHASWGTCYSTPVSLFNFEQDVEQIYDDFSSDDFAEDIYDPEILQMRKTLIDADEIGEALEKLYFAVCGL